MRVIVTAVAVAALLADGPRPAAAQDADGLEEAIERATTPGGDELAPLEAFAEHDLLDEAALDDLVAPVALYPDALLAQVLVAATYPLDMAKADRFLKANADLTEDELAEEVDAQDWDPSVKVLAGGFPTVIERMADELEWTEDLGLAMLQQDADVLSAVQRMRLRAEETGYLTSNDAQVVAREDGQVTITPADPDVVYVPSYDSTAAFTSAPTRPPLIMAPAENRFLGRDALTTGAIAFGAALLISELFDDEKDKDWRDYWRRPRPMHWREREFYPRPYRDRDDDDRDRLRGARWEAEEERARAVRRWRELRRELLRDERRQEERWGAELREERREVERQEERRRAARAEERREEARRAERREERRKATRAEERRKAASEEERRKDARAEARAEEKGRKAARAEEGRGAAKAAKKKAKAKEAEATGEGPKRKKKKGKREREG